MTAPQRIYVLTVSLVLSSMTTALFANAADPAAGATEPGQAVYEKMCKSCHGPDGRGNAAKATTLKIDATKLDLAREEVKGVARDDKKKVLLEGKEKMPAYGKKLKPDDVEPVLDYAMKLGGNGGAKAETK